MRVFISSTYSDLVDYRGAVIKALKLAEVNFEAMEFFTSDPCPPLNVVLKRLADCDTYVGILGARYGESPPGRKKSYTELEYEFAHRSPVLKKRILIFVLDLDRACLPVSLSQEPDERTKRREVFRKRVQRHTYLKFADPWELATKVLASLVKFWP